MGIGYKDERVAQLFGVQLRNSFVIELLRFRFFLTTVLFVLNFVFAF
jgi:hypothetical protein